jgi:hypothetical protein
MKKSGRSKPKSQNLFEELSKKLFSLFLIALSYLTYIVELRGAIQSNFGIYYIGFIDSAVIFFTIMIIVFFSVSQISKKWRFVV